MSNDAKEIVSVNTQNPDPNKTAVDSFAKLTLEFVDALCSVWDDDTVLQKTKLKIQIAIGDLNMTGDAEENKISLIKSWQKSLEPHYDACQKKDPNVFDKIELENSDLRDLRISEKYLDSGIDDDTRECIWEYVLGLNKFAQMYALYDTIPGGMMSKLTNMATQISNDITSGKSDLSNLDVMSLGKSVAESIDPQELEEFSKNMMSNLGSVQNLCSNVMGTVSDSNSNASPSLDLGSLSSVMGMLGKMM